MKRMNLMLRWLVRQDAVDVGGWPEALRHRLVVPLDTHMHRIAKALGATSRRAADGATAMEVSAAFRRLRPAPPPQRSPQGSPQGPPNSPTSSRLQRQESEP